MENIIINGISGHCSYSGELQYIPVTTTITGTFTPNYSSETTTPTQKPKKKSVYGSLFLPQIKRIDLLKDDDYYVGVKVTFIDGTTEKSICAPDDVFNFETGVNICLFKRILSFISNNKGSSEYNHIIKKAMKVYKKQCEEEHKKDVEKDEITQRRNRRLEKKKRRLEKRKAAEREDQIELQKEAYLRAMKEFKSGE